MGWWRSEQERQSERREARKASSKCLLASFLLQTTAPLALQVHWTPSDTLLLVSLQV